MTQKPNRVTKKQNAQAKKDFMKSTLSLRAFYMKRFGKLPSPMSTVGRVKERDIYQAQQALTPDFEEVKEELDNNGKDIDNKDDKKAQEALKQIQELDEKTIRNVGLIFKRGMYALMMEVQRNVLFEPNEKTGIMEVRGVKDINKMSKCLEELRIFAKMPKYYSAVKPTGLDDDGPIDMENGLFTNPISPVQIVLTSETYETDKNVPETIDDIQDVDGQGDSD